MLFHLPRAAPLGAAAAMLWFLSHGAPHSPGTEASLQTVVRTELQQPRKQELCVLQHITVLTSVSWPHLNRILLLGEERKHRSVLPPRPGKRSSQGEAGAVLRFKFHLQALWPSLCGTLLLQGDLYLTAFVTL